jgi:GNAT superfamily N-acetyltransferase
MVNVAIRPARPDDVETIVALWQELMVFHEARDPRFRRSATAAKAFANFVAGHIASEDSLVLVAEEAGTVVAYALATIAFRPPVFVETRYGAIYDLFVTDSQRRRGIGGGMVHAIERWFTGRGIRRVEVRVAVRNEVSTRFWRTLGYESYVETLHREL